MKILDTDVCIEILRGNQRVIGRRLETREKVATTRITAAELCYGAAKSRAPATNPERVDEFLATLPVLGLDLSAGKQFGGHKATLERQGNRLADADLFIAAITLSRGAALVTGNVRHYRRIPGLRIEDWIRGGKSLPFRKGGSLRCA